jgi:glycerol-3-phosphate dehydrogenase
LATPYEIVNEELPGKYAKYLSVLAGPSFAKEIAAGLPTNVSVAAFDQELAEKVQHQMSCRAASFRCYTTSDVMGCEISGAVKNVLAIASGAGTGLGLGNNARAGLICRGLAEMTHLAIAMGSDGKAMSGLAGVGDLLLTCSSELSRNFTVGMRLAKGETLEQITASTVAVAEGVATAKSLHDLAEKHGIDMPICEEVYQVLYHQKPAKVALRDLEDRPLSKEHKELPAKHQREHSRR